MFDSFLAKNYGGPIEKAAKPQSGDAVIARMHVGMWGPKVGAEWLKSHGMPELSRAYQNTSESMSIFRIGGPYQQSDLAKETPDKGIEIYRLK